MRLNQLSETIFDLAERQAGNEKELKLLRDFGQRVMSALRAEHEGLEYADLIESLSQVPDKSKIEVTMARTPTRVGRYLTWRAGLSAGNVYFVGASLPSGRMIVERVGP